MKHDYEAALKAEISWLDALEGEAKEHALTVIKALRLAAKVTGEPSYDMCYAGLKKQCNIPKTSFNLAGVFRAMIEQAQREIEG